MAYKDQDFQESFSYAEIGTKISANALVVGQKYVINNFRTRNVIPVAATVNVSNVIEALVVTAISTNQLSPIANSLLHPEDVLHYSYANSAEIAPGSDRGYIYKRHDTKRNIKAGFDWRYAALERGLLRPLGSTGDFKDVYFHSFDSVSSGIYVANNVQFNGDTMNVIVGRACNFSVENVLDTEFGQSAAGTAIGTIISSILRGNFDINGNATSINTGIDTSLFCETLYNTTIANEVSLTAGNFCSNIFIGPASQVTLANNCSFIEIGGQCTLFIDTYCTKIVMGNENNGSTGQSCSSIQYGNNNEVAIENEGINISVGNSNNIILGEFCEKITALHENTISIDRNGLNINMGSSNTGTLSSGCQNIRMGNNNQVTISRDVYTCSMGDLNIVALGRDAKNISMLNENDIDARQACTGHSYGNKNNVETLVSCKDLVFRDGNTVLMKADCHDIRAVDNNNLDVGANVISLSMGSGNQMVVGVDSVNNFFGDTNTEIILGASCSSNIFASGATSLSLPTGSTGNIFQQGATFLTFNPSFAIYFNTFGQFVSGDNFASSTHIRGFYFCEIMCRQDGTPMVRYLNNSNVQTIADINV